MATKKKMDLLTAVEQIVDKAKGSGLSSDFYRKADKYIKYMSERLDLTKEQSVMMALFIDNSDDERIQISDFGKFLECRTTRLIRYMSDIDVLEKREFVKCSRQKHSGISYRVPMEVIEAFKKNEKFVPKDCSGLSCAELFSEIETLFEARTEKEITYDALVEKMHHLLDSNKQLLYVQKVRSYALDKDDEMMLILFSHQFVNNSDDNIGFHDIDFLYDSKRRWRITKDLLEEGDHTLQEGHLIENNNSDGFVDREYFRMTDQAKRELFGELNLASLKKNARRRDVIRSEDIAPKKLFYGERISAQIAELGTLLEEEHYNQIRSRMRESGFRCGFTCLFYGEPGTGKTESVLQLARQTGRDIIQVSVSQIKSCWVGESEKNIKQLFDDYRARAADCERAPILLFNEADAIINKRQEGAEKAVDKMENSIQNMILQEMETLDGILIATTNLAQNMDKAFERRFLYKIKFEKPTKEARMNMWHEMIPTLGEEESRALATKYDFSGGQIENIARHYTIGNILHGCSNDIVKDLSAYCESERLEKGQPRKIGF
jgi:ABC-type oligopeptide transport system ATPase subunit